MFQTRVISDDGLKVTPNGFIIDVRLPWYRALPLSSVEIGQVKIDGETVDPDSITFELDGQTYQPNGLVEHWQEWWFVLDSGYLHIPSPELKQGATYEVEVTIALRPPYMKGVHWKTKCVKRLLAQ